ncbi:MAG TPA: DNA-binding domain-containing protein [Sphingopyxis sp.]|nr:DNA-binding domain-containing protein [Sphingopyxis sp.]
MLEQGQAAIAATLLRGPGHLPPDLFIGSDAAVLRGLRVHANTISHARLIALEETFPRTRDYLGEGEFNLLSRRFVDEGGAGRRSLNAIGGGFADWLADPRAADLARSEWAWLESYHAADAPALALTDLIGLGETELLALPVRRHPAVRIVALTGDAAPLVDPAFAADTRVLLVTRPDADVRLCGAEPSDATALDMAENIVPVGNLIAHLAEQHPDGGAAIAALIEAGAFERV